MKALNNYKQSLKEIYEYFGYEEKWTVYPIEDYRTYWWKLGTNEVAFYNSKYDYERNNEEHTYKNEFLYYGENAKNVYKGKEYTLIVVDTRTDGNIFLAIYDNSKQIN